MYCTIHDAWRSHILATYDAWEKIPPILIVQPIIHGKLALHAHDPWEKVAEWAHTPSSVLHTHVPIHKANNIVVSLEIHNEIKMRYMHVCIVITPIISKELGCMGVWQRLRVHEFFIESWN